MLEPLWQYLAENYLEIIAVILSVAGVWFAAKEKVINWPVNIVASGLYGYIFYKSNLFADSTLQIFFIIMSIYGWYEWLYGGTNKKELSISRIPFRQLGILALIAIPASLAVYYALTFTKSTTPWQDGITAVLSVALTWMAARKYIENWVGWIITDAAYVGLYIIKGLHLTALLYFAFIVLAVYGYYSWKKKLIPSFA